MPKNLKSKKRRWISQSNHPHNIGNDFLPGFKNNCAYYNVPVAPKNEVNLVQDKSTIESLEMNTTPASNEIRVIERHNLHKDWSLFYIEASNNPYSQHIKTNYWTDKFWKKEDEQVPQLIIYYGHNKVVANKKKQNKVEKSLNKMLAQPTEISKGRSLLEKMGWTGGGLGKEGTGIAEPIAPKATYAVKTLGLGHPAEKLELSNCTINRVYPTSQNVGCNFRTNVLLYILDFAKNDAEIEVLFDNQLLRAERKRVHFIAQSLREFEELEEFEEENYDERDLDIVQDIWKHNMFDLWTESQGVGTQRKLCLYKEARDHVYLVTPDDLREEQEDDDIEKQGTERNRAKTKSPEVMEAKFSKKLDLDEVKCDNNGTKIIEDSKNILRRIIEYFKEFTKEAKYTKFRSLGKFNDEEMKEWRLFYNICMRKDDAESEEKTDLLNALINSLYTFEVLEDCNGCTVIYKIKTNTRVT